MTAFGSSALRPLQLRTPCLVAALRLTSAPTGSCPKPSPHRSPPRRRWYGYWRAGRRPEALDLTTQLPSKADKDPDVRVVAHVVAAQLFLEQGAPDRAEATFRQASSAAVTLDDRRQLAVGRGDLLFRARRFDELRALLSQWRAGDDACLRTEAARREAMLTPLR